MKIKFFLIENLKCHKRKNVSILIFYNFYSFFLFCPQEQKKKKTQKCKVMLY